MVQIIFVFLQTVKENAVSVKRLIFIMLVAVWALLPTRVSAAEAAPNGTLQSIDRNSNRPQWDDLGMENILAVRGQSTVAPPSPVRLASNGRRVQGGNSHSSGVSPTVSERAVCNYNIVQCTPRFRTTWTRGYLYIIRCLRL